LTNLGVLLTLALDELGNVEYSSQHWTNLEVLLPLGLGGFGSVAATGAWPTWGELDELGNIEYSCQCSTTKLGASVEGNSPTTQSFSNRTMGRSV
jgi:hypothetical protein